MTCENCGAPVPLDRNRGVFVCGYCSSENVAPGAVDGVHILAESAFSCPTCSGLLTEGTIESQSILYCVDCRGMLIEMAGFVGLIQALRAYRDRPAEALPPRGPDARPLLTCPRCSEEMHNHFYCGPGNVWIDTCSTCAVNWLDKAELQRIVSAPDSTYSPPPLEYARAGFDDVDQDEDEAVKFFPFTTD